MHYPYLGQYQAMFEAREGYSCKFLTLWQSWNRIGVKSKGLLIKNLVDCVQDERVSIPYPTYQFYQQLQKRLLPLNEKNYTYNRGEEVEE